MWMTQREITAYDKTVAKAKEDLKTWQPRIARDCSSASKPCERVERAAELAAIDDPAAIRALEATLVTAGPRFGVFAPRAVIRKMPAAQHQPSATAPVRCWLAMNRCDKATANALKQRPAHDYVPRLLASLSVPANRRWKWGREARYPFVRSLRRRRTARPAADQQGPCQPDNTECSFIVLCDRRAGTGAAGNGVGAAEARQDESAKRNLEPKDFGGARANHW